MIDTDDKLPDYITLNVVILTTCLIKDDNKLCPQIFLEEAFYNELANQKVDEEKMPDTCREMDKKTESSFTICKVRYASVVYNMEVPEYFAVKNYTQSLDIIQKSL